MLVFAQKIVSKAEGRSVALASVTPSARALALAEETGKDPRLVELILRESSEVVRQREGLLIVRHRLGFTLANAGIDASNVDGDGPGLAAAGRSRRVGRPHPRRVCAARTGIDSRRLDHRQPRPPLAHGHGRHRHRRQRPAGAARSARPARPQRPPAGKHRDRPGRRARRGRVAGDGTGRRRHADRAGAWCALCPAEGSARDLVRPANMDLFR